MTLRRGEIAADSLAQTAAVKINFLEWIGNGWALPFSQPLVRAFVSRAWMPRGRVACLMHEALVALVGDLPNPATYLVLSKLKFPMTQTLMPVAKRLLVKQISKAA